MTGLAEARELLVRGERIPYRLYRSGRRTLEITVAAGGLVEVRAPAAPAIERIEQRLLARSAWIRRKVAARSPVSCELPRRFVSGETHRYLGRQYRLSVARGETERVVLAGGRLRVEVRDPQDLGRVRECVLRWMRRRASVVLRERAAALIGKPEFHGLCPTAVMVRTMATRWGSCSPSRRLLLNVMLIELPTSLVDYVIAHELCHLRVAKHGVRFERLLGRVMPDWRLRHERLARLEV